MKLFSALPLFLVASRAAACGPDGAWTAAGSTTVLPLAVSWETDYEATCPNVDITVEGGGSSTGAKLVCGVEGDAAIGMMSRGWKAEEATVAADGFTYNCVVGDMGYSAAQIVVANDGVTVFAHAGGDAADCISKLGADGLSLDQLRWMFSNYTEAELTASGWDPSSIISDGDDSTHLWSELHADCMAHPITVAAPNAESGTYEFFTEEILTGIDDGETLRYDFMAAGGDSEVVDYVTQSDDAVGFVGYPLYAEHADMLVAAPVAGVEPTPENISGGLYTPLGRQIYMNLRTSEVAHTAPYVVYGFTLPTVEGFVPLSEAQSTEMNERLASLM